MVLRVLESMWDPFVSALRARVDVETAGIVLAERLDGEVLLARHVMLVPEGGYLIRQVDRLRIDPIAINRLVRPAREGSLSIITVHTHPGTDEPWFSMADDAGDARLIPSLFAQTPGPHGSMVIAGNTGTPTGRVWSDAGIQTTLAMRLVGATLRSYAQESRPSLGPWHDRQRIALGDHGQVILRDLHVGVVGLGGTGSVTFAQLAHLGVGRITVVDGDRVEYSNVSRIIGARTHDAGNAWKVDVAARYASQLGLGTVVLPRRGHLGAGVDVHEIEGCDVVFSCVDLHTPRAILNRLAYRRAIVVIDMGTAFRLDPEGRVAAGVGRVVTIGPGRPCLGCWGHIDPSRLRIEALPAKDRALEAAEGYIEGADVPQPSVIAFNTEVAGAAVVEFLRLVTSFAGAEEPPMRLAFDFGTGLVRRNRLANPGACSICSASGTAKHSMPEAGAAAR